jgi:hypothetical protein
VNLSDERALRNQLLGRNERLSVMSEVADQRLREPPDYALAEATGLRFAFTRL